MHPCRPLVLIGRQGADLSTPACPTFGRRGADLPRDAPLSAPRPVGSRSQHPRLPHLWPAGSRPTPRCTPVGPSPLGRWGADLTVGACRGSCFLARPPRRLRPMRRTPGCPLWPRPPPKLAPDTAHRRFQVRPPSWPSAARARRCSYMLPRGVSRCPTRPIGRVRRLPSLVLLEGANAAGTARREDHPGWSSPTRGGHARAMISPGSAGPRNVAC